jgi:hypothetical protein
MEILLALLMALVTGGWRSDASAPVRTPGESIAQDGDKKDGENGKDQDKEKKGKKKKKGDKKDKDDDDKDEKEDGGKKK